MSKGNLRGDKAELGVWLLDARAHSVLGMLIVRSWVVGRYTHVRNVDIRQTDDELHTKHSCLQN